MTDPAPGAVRLSEPLSLPGQPITPADRCQPAGAALLAAGEQLRDYAADAPELWPGELRRRYDHVDRGALYAVAEWLEARAGLFGVERQGDVVGFDQ